MFIGKKITVWDSAGILLNFKKLRQETEKKKQNFVCVQELEVCSMSLWGSYLSKKPIKVCTLGFETNKTQFLSENCLASMLAMIAYECLYTLHNLPLAAIPLLSSFYGDCHPYCYFNLLSSFTAHKRDCLV